MPRPSRADEAAGLCDALNRGNLRAGIFKRDADFAAFEQDDEHFIVVCRYMEQNSLRAGPKNQSLNTFSFRIGSHLMSLTVKCFGHDPQLHGFTCRLLFGPLVEIHDEEIPHDIERFHKRRDCCA